MLKKLYLILILCVVTGTVISQDLSFNLSVITPKNPEPFELKVSASGSKIAIEPRNMGTPGSMTIIVDNAKGKQYMLMNANGQKMAMALNIDAANKAITKEPKVTVTKEVKTIDGYKCTRVICETDEQKSDLWITQDVGMQYAEFYKMFNSSKGPQASMVKIPELKTVKGFPIEIVSTDTKKGETVTMKIKNISKAKIDAKIFSLEGYQVMEAPGSKP